jgi:hypothetical protein
MTGLLKGKVINFSDTTLWVIETTTNHPHGPPIAHKLNGKRKSPRNIDADGFKSFDGRPIENHSSWWKIRDFSTADIYQNGSDLKVAVLYKTKVQDDHFGSYKVDSDDNWGEELRLVTAIYKSKRGRKIVAYEVSGMGSVDKQIALDMAETGELDNVVIAQNGRTRYLRTKPDKAVSNNLREIILA